MPMVSDFFKETKEQMEDLEALLAVGRSVPFTSGGNQNKKSSNRIVPSFPNPEGEPDSTTTHHTQLSHSNGLYFEESSNNTNSSNTSTIQNNTENVATALTTEGYNN